MFKSKLRIIEKVACMLAKYAEYANIGGNKTGGFGVTNLMLKT